MIEILFGESEAGSMKYAKGNDTILGGYTDDTAAVFEKSSRNKQNHSKGIPGTSKEVICLGFMLDMGDIKEAIDSQYRKDLIYSMYAGEQWAKDPEIDAELRETGNAYVRELNSLKAFLDQGEAVRIWYSSSPYAVCGFYHLCFLLRNYINDISVVKLPEYRMDTNRITRYSHLGEAAPEEYREFLQYERKLTRIEREMYASMWSELVEGNSPIRTIVNGRAVGAGEDFYDFLIWKRITKIPIKEACLIGDILGHDPIGIGDWWYASRINRFIDEGKIKVIEDSDNEYARTICLA